MDNLENSSYEEIEQQRVERPLQVNEGSYITRYISFAPEKLGPTLPMIISDDLIEYYDAKTISMKYTNSFNFSKLAVLYGNLNMTIGITSANKQEGKTLVASNMAVSLASGYHRTTVLVDLNFKNPKLHKVFDAPAAPGVVETMVSKTVHVFPTGFENLYLMTAGDCSKFQPGIQQTLVLRELLYTLKNEFDTVILDMPSVLPISEFPVHFINEIDGLITVVDTKHTKKETLKKIHQHIDEKRFVGYIFNRVDEND